MGKNISAEYSTKGKTGEEIWEEIRKRNKGYMFTAKGGFAVALMEKFGKN